LLARLTASTILKEDAQSTELIGKLKIRTAGRFATCLLAGWRGAGRLAGLRGFVAGFGRVLAWLFGMTFLGGGFFFGHAHPAGALAPLRGVFGTRRSSEERGTGDQPRPSGSPAPGIERRNVGMSSAVIASKAEEK